MAIGGPPGQQLVRRQHLDQRIAIATLVEKPFDGLDGLRACLTVKVLGSVLGHARRREHEVVGPRGQPALQRSRDQASIVGAPCVDEHRRRSPSSDDQRIPKTSWLRMPSPNWMDTTVASR